jgi:hypothetical protein
MARSKVVSLRECFSVVRDPRREHQRFHNLWDIIAITICAVISGADNWPDVEEYGRPPNCFFASPSSKTCNLCSRVSGDFSLYARTWSLLCGTLAGRRKKRATCGGKQVAGGEAWGWGRGGSMTGRRSGREGRGEDLQQPHRSR